MKRTDARDSLRQNVLAAIDKWAANEIGLPFGWKDNDLPKLFDALDAHLDAFAKREGIELEQET